LGGDAVVLLEPFDELRRMRRMMKGFFEPFWFEERWPEKRFRPALFDIEDKGDRLEITAEIPGVDKKDVKVNLTNDTMSIKAEKKEEKEEKKRNYYYKERSYGGFYRSITLPSEVDPKTAKATYKDGVLQITIDKIEKKEKGATEVKID